MSSGKTEERVTMLIGIIPLVSGGLMVIVASIVIFSFSLHSISLWLVVFMSLVLALYGFFVLMLHRSDLRERVNGRSSAPFLNRPVSD